MNYSFFFFNDTATTEIYTLSLHDALPILTDTDASAFDALLQLRESGEFHGDIVPAYGDRKSTRLNSSHGYISYAVFCLKKNNIGGSHRTLGRLSGGEAELISSLACASLLI